MSESIQKSLDTLMNVDGAIAVALVDQDSGMAPGTMGEGINLEVAAAGNSEVLKSKHKAMKNLGLKDQIEDVLISLGQQYHLIRPLTSHSNLFFYFVLNRAKGNLAMARFKLSEAEKEVSI